MDYVEERDIPVMLKMFDENLGEGYMSEEQIRHYINKEDELFYAARGPEGQLAGILLFGPENADDLSVQTRIPKEELLRMAHGKKLLKCRSMCMVTEYQRGGMGRQLFMDAMEHIKSLGIYGVITSCLWTYEGKVPAKTLHERCGFKFVHKLIQPWYHLDDYVCVYCKGRCRCDGDQYVLEL